jgi:hypothetical protein
MHVGLRVPAPDVFFEAVAHLKDLATTVASVVFLVRRGTGRMLTVPPAKISYYTRYYSHEQIDARYQEGTSDHPAGPA